MSQIAEPFSIQRATPQLADTRIMPWLALAALFVAALAMRASVVANTDVSWLLTAGERWLAGGTLYRDIIETNPPIAVLAYIPAILIARILHLHAEIVVDALTFIAIVTSLAICVAMLREKLAKANVRGWPLLWFAFAILAILPAQSFAQREHIAVVLMLPALAALVKRTGDALIRTEVLLAGIGAGLALCFKPHFAIGYGFAIVAASLATRRWHLLFVPEHWIAASLIALYAMCTFVFFPDFFSVIGPLVRDVYLAVNVSFADMMEKPAVALWLVAVLSAYAVQRRNGLDAPFIILMAASTGFAAVFFLQRKGWPYHSYPMLALALIALGYAIAATRGLNRINKFVRAAAATLLLALFVGGAFWFDYAFDARPLQVHIARLGERPKLLAFTAEPGIGHPLVRALDGEWVSRQQGLWVAAYAKRIRGKEKQEAERAATLESYEARERAMLLEDVRRTPPTVILVDDLSGDWSGWLNAHPDMAAVLNGFERADTINRVAIYRKKL